MSRKESLFRGAAALAVAGLIIKASNLLVRVPLTYLIGAEGLGIYQMALPAFHALFQLAAGGISVAVQNLVAEYTARNRRRVTQQILQIAMTYSVVVGGVATCILWIGAPHLARLLGEPRAQWSLMAVAPAVFLFAADSVYRNYLQGRNLLTYGAAASVLEQGAKVAVTVAAAYWLIPFGRGVASSGASLGITAGALASLLYMGWVLSRLRQEEGPPTDKPESRIWLARRMVLLAWPVALGSALMPVLNLVDVAVVQRGFLRAGYPPHEATTLYGAYQGIAVQVVWFPFVLTNALANALVPVLAAARARGDRELIQKRVLLGLRATGLICLPVAMCLAVMARPVARLFGDEMAAIPLLYMAPAAFLGPLSWLMTAQLQALGQTVLPMRNLTIGMVVKIVLDALLAPIAGIDVKGVALASVVVFVVSSWLNARALEAELGEPLPWSRLLRRPLLASVLSAGGLFGLALGGYLPEADWASLALALAVAPVLYLTLLIGTGALTWGEIRELSGPVGKRMERWFHMLWS